MFMYSIVGVKTNLYSVSLQQWIQVKIAGLLQKRNYSGNHQSTK